MLEPRGPHPEAPGTGATLEPDPSARYVRRLAELGEQVRRNRRGEWLVSISRLLTAIVGLVLLWLSLQSELLAIGWVGVPLLAFVGLMVTHERLLRRLGRLERAVRFYEQGMARLEERWAGGGETGDRYADPRHPYAADLDLFGRGSLFELLCRARTRFGEDCLARWLLEPPAPAEVRARQAAVAELRDRLELREELFSLGLELRSELSPEALLEWAHRSEHLGTPLLRALPPMLAALASGNVAAVAGWIFLGWGASPLLALGMIEVAGFLWLRRPLAAAIRGVDRASRDLLLLAEILRCFESESFQAPALVALRAELGAGEKTASAEIGRLQKLVDLLDSRRNPMFAPLGALLLWTSQLAFRVERWRGVHGRDVGRWLEIVGEVEALSSLAALAFERPRDPFPEIVDEGPILDGKGLGHPLIPEHLCVRNDLRLGGELRALVVSGSNMSGKSTFLRTTGTTVVLALAGSPVRASSLRVSPLAVGASIRLQDSLQEGASRFYAEIKRLRQILDLTQEERPVLFLLDEILHGTNSHDRRIGAEAVVRAFVDRGALGLVTTHDLALARIAEEGKGKFHNVHFEDTLEDGKIHFDYRLHPGVVTHSNALALMREVGLEV